MRIITILTLLATAAAAQPQLQSLPGAQNVILLHFNGGVVNNPNWSATPINAAASTLTDAQKVEVFWRTAEKFTPFNINITTIQAVYDATATNRRMRCFITPTSQWYGGAGGVAFVGSFGYQSYEPCWVFENMLSYNPKYVADAAAHEIGHTLWLNHHGQYDANCNRTNSYHYGKGTGETSWSPIMGAGYSTNVSQWYNGTTTTLQCFGNVVDDLNKITTFGSFVTYKNDDRGNDITSSLPIGRAGTAISDSGIIERTGDVDVFKITAQNKFNISLNCKPYSLSPMLDTKIELLNSAGEVLALDSNLNTLQSNITRNDLSAGTYFIRVSGSGHPNYVDYGSTQPNNYGSLGRYYITGTITEMQVQQCNTTSATFTTDCKATTIALTPVQGATLYTIQYTNTGEWMQVSQSSPTFVLPLSSIFYDVKMQVTCGTIQSAVTMDGYRVPKVSSPAPTFELSSSVKGRLTTTITDNGALKYNIRYKLSTSSTWTSYTTTNLTSNRNKLQSGKIYDVQVRSVCLNAAGEYSATKQIQIK